MTALNLDAIEARVAAATVGPWTWAHDGPFDGWLDDATDNPMAVCADCGVRAQVEPSDAEFIAHARTDVPALVSRVRELERRNTQLGIERARTADALDRVGLYAKNLTEVFNPGTEQSDIGHEIVRRITTNPGAP